jgi:translation initiation factor IF-2
MERAEPTAPAPTSAPAAGVESPDAQALISPAGPQNVPKPLKLKGPRVVRYEAPEPDQMQPRRPAPPSPGTGLRRPGTGPSGPGDAPGPDRKPVDPRTAKKQRVNPRRVAANLKVAGERLAEWGDRDLAERRERLAGATGRKIHRRRQPGQPGGPASPERKTIARVHEPVRLKEFCSETGSNFMQCFKILKDQHNILANINMVLPTDTAQLLALELGVEVEIVPARTQLDTLKDEVAARERKGLVQRPPVVAMLGHVDHGKTSLLDAIRSAEVASGEDGGITQHIGAYHVVGAHGPVTFLDTPGHEAFSAMRARGANLTDVVVLVIAADDGVMPQTIEAMNHAKAANVTIVVALNKIDLGEQNVLKIYGQLSEHELAPTEWGGHVDVLKTSASTGQGIKELVDHLADLSALMDLKADPSVPAVGVVVEAQTKQGVGPVATVLVQEGTLRVGDMVVCGNAFGKVRALVNDRGQRLESAGPAVPVEVWGLDDVPVSSDGLFVVENMQRAKTISAEMKQTRIASGRQASRKILSLEDMFKRRDAGEVPELNVIVKADVDGSVETLKQTLGQLPSDEVRLVIRHAGVGPVNDSDVLLASACEGIVVAYRVETPAGVRRLAERHGVEVRPYRVVYDVTDDIKKALEGLLTPDEIIESRGIAQVREVFRITRLGVVAGCYVTEGVIHRSHVAKLIRDGVVVRDGSKLESLRRFKDDVKEVRAGMECGIRLEGFDDVHAGDVIEVYEVVKVARTL